MRLELLQGLMQGARKLSLPSLELSLENAARAASLNSVMVTYGDKPRRSQCMHCYRTLLTLAAGVGLFGDPVMRSCLLEQKQ